MLIALLFAWNGFVGTLQASDWGATTNNIQMSVALKNGTNGVKAEQPIVLLIRYRNASTNQVCRIYRSNEIEYDPGYTWSVISPSGNDLSPNPEKIHASESGGFIRLPPNQIVGLEFDLSQICRFDEIGTYKIVAKKEIFSPEAKKPVTVISNPLNIVVVP